MHNDIDIRARIAVVVVTFNSGAVLAGCLRSIAGQTDVEVTAVVVADNASKDDCIALAESTDGLPVRTVQLGRNAGYAAAINAGIAVLDLRKLDAVLVLNPDCRLRPDALQRLALALREPGRAVAVPLMLNPDGTLQPSLRRTPTVVRALAEALLGGDRAGRIGTLSELVFDPREYERARTAAWATGAAMLLSADAVRELGPWDESFLLYSEETEYCLRAGDRGWSTWFAPDAVVEHIGGDSGTNPLLAALLTVNKVVLFRRRHGALESWAYFSAITVGEAVRAVAGRRTARASLLALVSRARQARIREAIVGGPA